MESFLQEQVVQEHQLFRLFYPEAKLNIEHRFPKLTLVDEKYAALTPPEYDNEISLQEFAEGYRRYAASQMKLYYTPEIVRRFVAGMAASKLLILEGISGTGKTSLPYSFSRYLSNPSTIVSVQPSFRDRTELLGYFNEFSKRFNETEFLRALYEANYRPDPTLIVLDEMNLELSIILLKCFLSLKCPIRTSGCLTLCLQHGMAIQLRWMAVKFMWLILHGLSEQQIMMIPRSRLLIRYMTVRCQ
ncbi:MAG: hypothetical protein ACLRZ6_06885 [Lachnospiraceae bacterium]